MVIHGRTAVVQVANQIKVEIWQIVIISQLPDGSASEKTRESENVEGCQGVFLDIFIC